MAAQPQVHAKHKPVAVLVVVTLLGMLFAGSFLGALHRPSPHDVPVGVVAAAEPTSRLGAALDQHLQGAFDLRGYPSEAAARAALLDREIDGVFAPGPSGNKLLVAGAVGRTTSSALTQAFQAASQGTGQPLTVQDVRPLPADDGNGVASMFFVLTLTIPAIALVIMLGVALPRLGRTARFAMLVAGSLLIAGANTWMAAGLTGALSGAPWGLWAAGTLIVFTVGAATGGLLHFGGPPGALVAALLFIPIGVPASGGPVGSNFIPRWYAALGEALPVGAGINAVRNLVYFNGNALSGPLWVLAAWALAGTLLLMLVPPVRRRAPAPADADLTLNA